MKDTLIVYYSRSGTTRRVAEQLAAFCRCDSEQIQDVRGRSGMFGMLRSLWDALFVRTPTIRALKHKALQYDLVVIGAPVWVGKAAAPARSYITRHRGEFNRVAFFCTMSGSGGDKALQEMAGLAEKTPLATLCLTEAEVGANRHVDKAREFADTLTQAVSRNPPKPRQATAAPRNEHA
jgi:flavodoxin